jgi:hypothetical protein
MSGYTKTTIIECARSQSEEAQNFNDSNPAQWTNRVGTGLKLKPGDTISVHSSFVSEIGAEAGQIQIKGEELGKEVEVEHINSEKILFEKNLPEKFQLENASLVKTKIQLRDDTLNMVVSPYKCSNGENYAFLPRNWAALASGHGTSIWNQFDQTPHVTGTYIGQVSHARPELNMCPADVQKVYGPYSTSTNPPPKVSGKNDGSRFTIFKAKQTLFTSPDARTSIIGQAVAGSPVITLKEGGSTSSILVNMSIHSQSPKSVFTGADLVLSTTANTITMNANASDTTTIHNIFEFGLGTGFLQDFLPPTTASVSASFATSTRDPAILMDYIQVKDLIQLKVNPGYNSPTDVATQLTEEINERTDTEFFQYDLTHGGLSASNQTLTFKTESPAYKLYHCATATSYQALTHDEFMKVNGTWDVDKAYSYLSSYQHIGIKRPELYVAGKKLNGPDGMRTEPGDFTRGQDKVFMTSIPWTRENLLLFKEFFDTQVIYPELFDDYRQSDIPVSAERNRLLHMNIFDDGPNDPDSHLYPSNFGTNIKSDTTPPLGYDYYLSADNASQGTFPLFIDYNPDTEDFNENDVGYADYGDDFGTANGKPMESDYEDLAFGFARKIRRKQAVAPGNVGFFIGFQFTQTGDKIPAIFLQENKAFVDDDPQIGTAGGRRFGFDYHFSAYGTLAMVLYNGNTDEEGRNRGQQSAKQYSLAQNLHHGTEKLDKYQFGVYLGADEPLLNYSETQQRFTLESFHTAERENQDYNAGGFLSGGDSVPKNPNADKECYKINKYIFPHNWCPDVGPYTNEFSASLTAMGTPVKMTSRNESVTPYSIMDAHSGLFIEDWVVPEDFWNRSLAGIMGFRYNQFHNPNTTSSRQVRIKSHGANADLHNVNVITTNADVNEGDLIEYSKMIQNTGNFQITNIVNNQCISTETDATKRGQEQARNVLPVITITPVESVKITAERMPTKTLRPYYTIRSDIIEENGYLGGTTSGITLPIVSVTNKANPYGDFLNGMGGDLVFTNTIDRVLTRIRCSIHEPNGELARCDLNSAVIFKIDQQINADLNLVDTLMESKNKEDQEEAELAKIGPDYSKIDYSQALVFK